MKTEGKHVTADLWVEEPDASAIGPAIDAAMLASKMTVLGKAHHDFGGGAVTTVLLLAESHFSLHTFPERNFMSVDCYTCGTEGDPLIAVTTFANHFQVANANIKVFKRGTL